MTTMLATPDADLPAGLRPAVSTGLAVPALGVLVIRDDLLPGVELFTYLRHYLATYVAFRTEAELNLVTAWIIAAAARLRNDSGLGPPVWRSAPRLMVTSRKRGSGKSTLLELIVILLRTRNGVMLKITPAKIAKMTGERFETPVLDEAKMMFGAGNKSAELQSLLLGGYTRRGTYSVANKDLSLFSFAAFAAKDELITDTSGALGDLLDRSFITRFEGSALKPELDEDAEEDGDILAESLIQWTDDERDRLLLAARVLAAEDKAAAEEREQAGLPQPNPRTVQISRPLRAVGMAADGGVRQDGEGQRIIGPLEQLITKSVREVTGGEGGAELTRTMVTLRQRAAARWQHAKTSLSTSEPAAAQAEDEEDDEL